MTIKRWLIAGALCAAALALSVQAFSLPGAAHKPFQEQKVVRLGLGSSWKDLIPYNNGTGGFYSSLVLGLLYDRLFYIQSNGDILPRGAKSWDIADDRMSITFHLDPKARWSDGTPVTAGDYVFAARYITDPENPAAMKSRYSILRGVNASGKAIGDEPVGAEEIDEYTVRYDLNMPLDINDMFATMIYDYMALPHHLLKDVPPKDYLTAPIWHHPVTNGPLEFQSQIAGSELTMKANETYHLGKLDFDIFQVQVMTPTNMPYALLAGDLDLAYPPMTDDNVKALESVGRLKVKHMPRPSQPFQLIINQRVYKDKRIRQAVDKAIDREFIAKVLQHAVPVETPILPGSHFYDESVTYEYNPEKAKALLQEAAADGAIDLSQPITLATSAGVKEKAAGVIQQNLADIGMTVKVQVMESSAMFTGLYKGTVAMAQVNNLATMNPMYLKNQLNGNIQNYSGITYHLWDDFYKEYIYAPTDKEKMEVMSRWQKAWTEDVPQTIYAAGYEDYTYSSRLSGYIGLEDSMYGNLPVWNWKVADK